MNLKKIIGVFALILFIASCGSDRTREEKLAAIISQIESPYFMVNVNAGDLIKKSGVLNGALPFMFEQIADGYMDAEKTGIDVQTNLQVVIGDNGASFPSVYGLFKLSNEKAFREFLEEEAGLEILEMDKFAYASSVNEGYVVVWNEEFVMVNNIPFNMESLYSGEGEMADVETVKNCIQLLKTANKAEINDTYLTFIEKEGDANFAFDGKNFYQFLNRASNGANDELISQKDKIEALKLEMALNFNDGAINLNVASLADKDVSGEYNVFMESGIRKSLMNLGLSKHPVMAFAFNLNLDKISDLFEENFPREFKELKGDVFSASNLRFEDIKAASTGEFLVLVDNVKFSKKDILYGDEKINGKFALVFGIEDKASILKLIPDSLKENMNGVMRLGEANIFVNDDYLFASNDSLWATKIASGNGVSLTSVQEWDESKPFNFSLNCEPLTRYSDFDEANAVLSLLTYITMQADSEMFNLDISFKNKEINALRNMIESVGRKMTGMDKMEREFENAVEEGDIEDMIELLDQVAN
ncbi:hypothetical protein [Crocinitomix catalasitica]|uniref:hypothetical protein n=1 Tax=Crocinitomix catalasitica TaxID=184607 RepID=UPI000484BC6B|nr:hypothetical protein [Crocinitomix catalasitica]